MSTDAHIPYVPYAAVFACGPHAHPLWMTYNISGAAGIRKLHADMEQSTCALLQFSLRQKLTV